MTVVAPCTKDNNQLSDIQKRVQFEIAEIIEFEPTIYTATVSSDGVPVGMSVQVRRRTRRRLDSFEVERKMNRVTREEYMDHGYLEPEERLDILEGAGHTLSTISSVEREVTRINRERWESNEYDLMYQYGLGEIPMLEMDDEEIWQSSQQQQLEEDEVMMEEEDEATSTQSGLMDAELRFAMEMDCYDPFKYEELRVDYNNDCLMDDSPGTTDVDDQLPYAKDSFDDPFGFDVSDMSSSPSDVSSPSDCMIVSCSARPFERAVSSPTGKSKSLMNAGETPSAGVVAA